MTYTSVALPSFNGGLNLKDQPDNLQLGQALDLLNVTFTDLGGVRSRDGYAAFTTSEGANRYDSLTEFYKTDDTRQLVAGAGNRLEAISTTGAVIASSTSPTAFPHFFSRFGGPTAQLVYCANGTDQLRTWDGSAFATPTWTGTAPTGKFVAVTPWDNRLVNARRSGSTGGNNPSSVRFSDPGVPTTWGANNYVDLTPGDGEEIKGLAVFNGQLLVFKETKFFRFYGTTTDSTGQPVFNYQTVDTGVGLSSPKALSVGFDGVYFLNRQGVYRTTGGVPQSVSGLISPFFTGQGVPFVQGPNMNLSHLDLPAMAIHQEQLFLSVPTGASTANDKTLVFNTRYGWWTLFDIPAAAVVSFRAGSNPELLFAYARGLKHVGRHSSAYTTDAGSPISSRWRGGWADLGVPDVKTIRESKVWGNGAALFGVGADYGSTNNLEQLAFSSISDVWGNGTSSDTWGDGTGSDTWGAGSSAPTPCLPRNSVRGTVFSIELRNLDSRSWMVSRLTHSVRERRVPSVIKE